MLSHLFCVSLATLLIFIVPLKIHIIFSEFLQFEARAGDVTIVPSSRVTKSGPVALSTPVVFYGKTEESLQASVILSNGRMNIER